MAKYYDKEYVSFFILIGLQPSMEVFNDMMHELQIGRNNPDGADQGFLTSYFPDLLGSPQFLPPPNNTKLEGSYRLPLGYQMDASYFCKHIPNLVLYLILFSCLLTNLWRILFTQFRSEAKVECTMRSKQCHNFPRGSVVEAVVLVVVAGPPVRHRLASETPRNYRVSSLLCLETPIFLGQKENFYFVPFTLSFAYIILTCFNIFFIIVFVIT